jgi:UrcA family protein
MVRVTLADLDLSTPEGARIARDRLQDVARRLCAQLAVSSDVGRQWHLHACIHEAFSAALRQISPAARASITDSRPVPDVVRK